MEFCENCKNYLFLKECKHEGNRALFYYCKKCDFKKECINKKISFKIYKQTEIKNNDSYMNKYKANDVTLPSRSCKCPKCKKINNNPYERKYVNNSFQLNIFCKNCFYNWFF